MSAPGQPVVSQSTRKPSAHEIFDEDPLALFDAWFDDATQSELNDPNAVALATATPDGYPSVRMVLIKPITSHDHPDGLKRFCFFTNIESQKGHQLTENPHAAICFHWKSLRRQVRVSGGIVPLDSVDVDSYFHSRSRKSQIGAAVSQQSRTLDTREELERQAAHFAATHPAEIPRPDYWRGFELYPQQIEFWIDGPDRLHDRFLFTRTEIGWQRSRLYP